MPGRTDQQCMGRWKRHLDPGICRAPWTAAEDALLTSLVGEHGHAWSTISSALEGRIAQQCRSRWKQLNAVRCHSTPGTPFSNHVAHHDQDNPPSAPKTAPPRASRRPARRLAYRPSSDSSSQGLSDSYVSEDDSPPATHRAKAQQANTLRGGLLNSAAKPASSSSSMGLPVSASVSAPLTSPTRRSRSARTRRGTAVTMRCTFVHAEHLQ